MKKIIDDTNSIPLGKKDVLRKITQDKDFINSNRYNNSLLSIVQEYPNGVPDRIICRVLKISQKKLDMLYKRAIIKIRKVMKVNVGEV